MATCLNCGQEDVPHCPGIDICYRYKELVKDMNAQTMYNTPRSKLLMEVMEIVHKDRNANYGNPEDNFSQIAALWQAYYDARIKATSKSASAFKFQSMDVAVMNMLIKVARLAKNPSHHDSAVDIAGYAACAADIQEILKASSVDRVSGSASA